MAQMDLEESPVSLDSHSETAGRRKVSEEVNRSNEGPKKPGASIVIENTRIKPYTVS